MTALKSYLDEIALLATLAQDNSVKYYLVALGAEKPHPNQLVMKKRHKCHILQLQIVVAVVQTGEKLICCPLGLLSDASKRKGAALRLWKMIVMSVLLCKVAPLVKTESCQV